MRGEACYQKLVDVCRALGVVTSEDPYPTWQTATVPVVVAPLFVLYDYAFRPAGTFTKEKALSVAASAGVVCTDKYFLHPDPYPTREDWCRARLAYTRNRLACLNGMSTVLVNHWPLHREPTQILRHPEFGLWCGTDQTARWRIEYNAKAWCTDTCTSLAPSSSPASTWRKCRWNTRGSGNLSGHAATGCVKCYPVYRIKAPKRLRI